MSTVATASTIPCPFRKFHLAWIRIVWQNHRMIGDDARNPAIPRNVHYRLRTLRYRRAWLPSVFRANFAYEALVHANHARRDRPSPRLSPMRARPKARPSRQAIDCRRGAADPRQHCEVAGTAEGAGVTPASPLSTALRSCAQ